MNTPAEPPHPVANTVDETDQGNLSRDVAGVLTAVAVVCLVALMTTAFQ